MPMIPMNDLPQPVKPGDSVTLKVTAVKDGNVEFDYNDIQVDESEAPEMSPEDMNKPEVADQMKNMNSDQMRRRLPKADRG